MLPGELPKRKLSSQQLGVFVLALFLFQVASELSQGHGLRHHGISHDARNGKNIQVCSFSDMIMGYFQAVQLFQQETGGLLSGFGWR